MPKFLTLVLFSLCGLVYAQLARADIDALKTTISETTKGVQQNIQEVQDLQTAVQDAKTAAQQGFDAAKTGLDNVVDTATNPQALAAAAAADVMQGMQGGADGSATDDEGIDNVKNTYNRAYGIDNNIKIAKELAAKINEMQGQSAARLYARALILRQDLLAEENPDDKLDTIEDALKASQSMLIQSSRRWNKILEMQAYINEYKNTVQIQNFTVYDEENADE